MRNAIYPRINARSGESISYTSRVDILLFGERNRACSSRDDAPIIFTSQLYTRMAWSLWRRTCMQFYRAGSSVCSKVLTLLCRGACCTALRTSPKVCCFHRNSCPPQRSRRPICTPPSLSWNLLAQKRDQQISPPIDLMANVQANNALMIANFIRYFLSQRHTRFFNNVIYMKEQSLLRYLKI